MTKPERHSFVKTPDGVGVVLATSREYAAVALPEYTTAYRLSEITPVESELTA